MILKKALRTAPVFALLFLIPSSGFCWRFASIADSRGSTNGVNAEILTKIIDQISREKVDLVIYSGDLVDSKNDEELATMLDGWKQIMSKLDCPYYVSTGNHDLPKPTSDDVIRTKFDFPQNGPKDYKEMVYSFDHKDAHFICLSTEEQNDRHRIQPAQRAWLRVDLAMNKQPHVFVFTHDPAFPKGPHIDSSLDMYPRERDALWSLLSTHGVRMYFCGHEHLYARDEKDGVIQVLNGSCGAPLSKNIPGTRGVYQYVIVDVEGKNVKATAKDENGVIFDSWEYTLTRK